MNWTNLRKAIIMILVENGEMSRSDICRRLGYESYIYEHIQSYPYKRQPKSRYYRNVKQYKKRTTVYDNLDTLYQAGYVKYEIVSNGKRGRPTTYWSVTEK